jgi:hypothetical protein
LILYRNLGTGKTESVKDLAKALGILCVVTNCGEGMDSLVSYQSYKNRFFNVVLKRLLVKI